MQGHALVLQRPYTISDRINLVVAKEIQSMLNMKLAEMNVHLFTLCTCISCTFVLSLFLK